MSHHLNFNFSIMGSFSLGRKQTAAFLINYIIHFPVNVFLLFSDGKLCNAFAVGCLTGAQAHPE
jgi:hypothetical protein